MSVARRVSADAELRKLARTLGVQESELAMLDGVPGDDIVTLRKQIAQRLFDADKHYFTKMAALSKAAPIALVAKLTEVAVPPLMAARTAELIEVSRGQDLIARLPARYLADVAAVMDASRSPQLIKAVDPDRVAGVGTLLAERGDWVVMGGFVSHVSEEALASALGVLDGGQLLRVAYVLDGVERLDRLVDLLTDQQVDELLTAAPELDAWAELADLLVQLDPARQARLAQRFAGLPDPVRAAYAAAADAGAVDPDTLALVAG